ncbi:MAG: CBS domain-containing protein [Candidatus Omnitrophica bacterium]|nr:CBS domain-containing protein [Candidatus Omnitrophota bacterium]
MEHRAKKEIQEMLCDTPVSKIMTTRVFSLKEDANLSQAVRLFGDQNLTHLPVVDENNKVVGILSHMYVYKTQAPRKFVEGEITAAPDMVIDGDTFYLKETLDRFNLKSIMKPNPMTINQKESLAVVVHAMANRRIGCIPVVDDLKNLVGIITNQDVINFLAMTLV